MNVFVIFWPSIGISCATADEISRIIESKAYSFFMACQFDFKIVTIPFAIAVLGLPGETYSTIHT